MRLSASSHLAIAIFCWLPPEKAPTRRHRARAVAPRRDRRAPRDRRGLGRACRSRPQRAKRVDDRQRDVVLAVQLQEQRLGLAILRHQADADVRADRIARRGQDDRPPVDRAATRRSAAPCRSRPGTAPAGPCPAGRRRRGSRRGCSAKPAPRSLPAVASPSRLQHRRAARRGRAAARRKGAGERAADDHADHLVVAHLARRLRCRCCCRCAAPSAGRRSAAPRAGGAR